MTRVLFFALTSLVACDADTQTVTDPGTIDDNELETAEDTGDLTDETPPAYLGEIPESDPPRFNTDEVATAIEDAIDQARGITAGPVLNVYNQMMAGADADCPQWTVTDEGDPLWLDNCTSSLGVTFDGYGVSVPLVNSPDGGGNVWNGVQMFSVAQMTGSGGGTLSLGGSAGMLTAVNANNGNLTYYTYLGNGYSWDGVATGSWLDQAVSPELSLYAIRNPNSGATITQLSALITIDEGPIAAVVMDNLYMLRDPLGNLCSAEPSGTISLLDADGRWYDLIFDGPTAANWEVPTETCDGCATAWYRGTSLGTACIDFSALTNWETSPW